MILRFLWEARYFHYWTDFDGSETRSGNAFGNADSLVEVRGIDQVIAAQLLTRFGKRSVDDEPFAVAYANAGGSGRRMKRRGVQISAAGMDILREPGGLQVTFFALGLAQSLFIQINQQHVSHLPASISKSNGEVRNRHVRKKFCLFLSMLLDANVAIENVYRSDWGRIVAALIRLFGDFDFAEEVTQEAFAAAVDQWRSSGIPENPRAWLIQTARHKAIDRIRRKTSLVEKLESYAILEASQNVE